MYVVILQQLFMEKRKKPYNLIQLASAVFMILALLWLTISTPFVYANAQKQSALKIGIQSSLADTNEEESANPFGNTTEEKNPNSSNSLSEEYLHDQHLNDHFFSIASQNYKCED